MAGNALLKPESLLYVCKEACNSSLYVAACEMESCFKDQAETAAVRGTAV